MSDLDQLGIPDNIMDRVKQLEDHVLMLQTRDLKADNLSELSDTLGALGGIASSDEKISINANEYITNWWLPLGLSTDNVTAIYCQLIVTIGGKKYLYVGGSFARIGGVTASNIARYNYETRQWEALPWGIGNNGVNGAVRVIAYNPVDGWLYIGGDFTNANGDAWVDYVAMTGLTFDDPTVSWDGLNTTGYELNGIVRAIAFDSAGNVYVGGDFTNAGGDTAADYFAKNSGSGWVNVNGAAPYRVYTIAINTSDEIFIGGAYPEQGFIRKGSGGAWADYNSSGTDYHCYKLAFDANGLLYAAAVNLLIDNGDGTWKTVSVSAYAVLDVAFDANGYPMVCGSFLDIDGVDAMRAAWFDGATWRPLTNAGGLDGLGGTVYSIIADPDTNTIYAGGDFDTAGTIQCVGIAAFCRPLSDALDIMAGLFEQYAAYFLTIYAPIAKGVTNGDSHDHSGGDGAQIAHGNLSAIGTNSHATIDSHLASTSNPHSTTAAQVGALGYALSVSAGNQATLTDGQTIYWGNMQAAPGTGAAAARVIIPKAGTIKAAAILVYALTAGSNENWSMYIRVNNTTDYLIETEASAVNGRSFINNALNIAVNAGDYIEIKEVHPTWTTNPANATRNGSIYIEP